MRTCPNCQKNIRGWPRYPLQPLADLFNESVHAMSVRLNVSGSTLKEYQCHGITEQVADRLAARAGVPAYSVWPELLDFVVASSQRECAAVDCAVRFSGHPNRRYCSEQCRCRMQARRYRERHPEKYLAKMRRWKAENADEWRAYNRRYQRRWMREYRARKKQEQEDVA